MSVPNPATRLATTLADGLRASGFSPFFGTPCGILAPLYTELSRDNEMLTIAREDSALGVAAGCALSGMNPVVLMQNSGFGQSVNAVASLISPYSIPVLIIISMRGTGQDSTEENQVMGRTTEWVLRSADVRTEHIGGDNIQTQVRWARNQVVGDRKPAALLVSPALFGWNP
jgi:sulfopyruvate decarboxylase subunit alpha